METRNEAAPDESLALLTEQNTRLRWLVAELLRKNEELRRGLARPGATATEEAN
jgi:hypothetical protein